MTAQDAIILAKDEMYQFQADGFVIIQYPPFAHQGFRDAGYHIDYDYELFTDYDQMKKYISGGRAYNYLDDYTYLRDGETAVYAYHKNKIIIL